MIDFLLTNMGHQNICNKHVSFIHLLFKFGKYLNNNTMWNSQQAMIGGVWPRESFFVYIWNQSAESTDVFFPHK